jgi:signal transduction histidine kinase
VLFRSSDASHELRTPIAVIQGYASMLERWGKTDKAVLDEGIAAISQETASMKELVERLLFLARHDKKTLMLEMEVFDPAEIMSSVHRDAKLLSSAHEFELSPLTHCSVNGDKGMLKQLMRILVDNAIKYTPPGGKITLGMSREGSECVLSVRDTGQGISADEMPRIFDRFYRSDNARKAQSSGHGLGLSIARIIVVAHGGKMTVRSKEGVGTTFRVRLPLAREES